MVATWVVKRTGAIVMAIFVQWHMHVLIKFLLASPTSRTLAAAILYYSFPFYNCSCNSRKSFSWFLIRGWSCAISHGLKADNLYLFHWNWYTKLVFVSFPSFYLSLCASSLAKVKLNALESSSAALKMNHLSIWYLHISVVLFIVVNGDILQSWCAHHQIRQIDNFHSFTTLSIDCHDFGCASFYWLC